MSNLTSLSCSVSIHFAEMYDVILSILTKTLMDIGNTNTNTRQPVSFSQTAPLAISRREVDVYMDKLQRALLKLRGSLFAWLRFPQVSWNAGSQPL